MLGRVVTLSDPELRAWIQDIAPDQLEDVSTLPAVGCITIAVRCTGLDLAEICKRISEFCNPTDDPIELIVSLIALKKPATLMIDSLDEAINDSEAHAIASRLLRPLASDGADSGIKVLVGTRPGHQNEYINALGGRSVIDLDDSQYFDIADLALYAKRCLQADPQPGKKSAYVQNHGAANDVADAIAERAQPSFLVAGLTARTRADEPAINTTLLGWRESQCFPHDVAEAMAEYLSRLPNADRALECLVPLAFGHHPGLPLTLWKQLVTSYSGTECTHAEMNRLLRGAASYVVEQRSIDGETVFRLFHQALVEHIRERVRADLVEETFIRVLQANALSKGGWPNADKYSRRHAAAHAIAAGGDFLDDLLADAGFLAAIDRADLLRTFDFLRKPESTKTAEVYRAAAHWLTGRVGVNAAYLELAAYLHDNAKLGAKLRSLELDQPFTVIFLRHDLSPDHLTLIGHDAPIQSLAWGTINGQSVLASASYGVIRIWDSTSGTTLFEPIHTRRANLLAFGELDGRTVIVQAGWEDVILWNPVSGEKLASFHDSNIYAIIRSIAWGAFNGRPSVAIVTSQKMHIWDLVANKISEKRVPFSRVEHAAWGNLHGRSVLAFSTGGPSVEILDPSVGRVIKSFHRCPGGVRALAWINLRDHDVLAIATAGRVLLWDPIVDIETAIVTNNISGVSALAWENTQRGGTWPLPLMTERS